ncbi:hypothetical protein RFI_21922 [Reticulomyxa filosa]|uniref:Uncharacterized protein n=1 Tax=Reticulomyxa filosa TaxID=46433 RepID=X6MP68_RETFI|nr:hypothetical protein RFI_21922 [Reticulomyxa filosa]|eukprot:ETO15441.1 hypothetical protein RFI_21922 [Reticulomyxa filosa]
MSNEIFQILKELPTPLMDSQCMLHKHELLICGGLYEKACYSYHILKNEYPSHVTLYGHSVIKLVDSNSNNDKHNNIITLLYFGGLKKDIRYTLVMKYVSIWSDDENENETNKSKQFNQLNELNKSNNYNEWTPFTDNHNHPIIIGRDYDDYQGMRALIGGINNHLLFITYPRNNIIIFDLLNMILYQLKIMILLDFIALYQNQKMDYLLNCIWQNYVIVHFAW